jgi:hypothetical protein
MPPSPRGYENEKFPRVCGARGGLFQRKTMSTNESSGQESGESVDELPTSTTRFGHYAADSIEDMAEHSNAMRSLSDADSLIQKDSYGLAANSIRAAARRLNRVADSLQAEHESDTTLDFPDVDFEDYHFSENDYVSVDWTEGQGPKDEITGIVESIHRSAGETVVGVTDYGDENFPQGRQYDSAPEWITVVYESR